MILAFCERLHMILLTCQAARPARPTPPADLIHAAAVLWNQKKEVQTPESHSGLILSRAAERERERERLLGKEKHGIYLALPAS